MEEQLKVLKIMSEVTSRIDMNAFAQLVNLNLNQTIERMQDLVDAGLIRKLGSGYSITEKGKTVLKAITSIPKDLAFHFYTEVGKPAGFSAGSLRDFYEIVKRISVKSVEFHLYRGDFENWIKTAFKDEALANELARLKNAKITGEEIRQEILKSIVSIYNF